MRYFVTGATGFIGKHLVRRLRESGHDVVALVRDPLRAREFTNMGVKLCEGDITDRDSMRISMEGCDGVYHLAAWYKLGGRDRNIADKINVQGTSNVLNLMKDLGIPRGVYTSSLAIFGDTHGKVVDETYKFNGPFISRYDRSKWEAHYNVAIPLIEQGLPLIIVQPGLTYGPGDTSLLHETIVQYLNGKLNMAPRRTAFCWAHVDDTVDGHIKAMEQGKTGESYIIAGPVHTLIGAFELAERITGVPAPSYHPNPWTISMVDAFMKIYERFASVPALYSSEALAVMAGSTYLGSSAKAEQDLGFTARSLDEGLGETLKYEMDHLKKNQI